MSGHSKWSQIKHKKGIADQKRGQLFSKLSKNIILAVKEKGDNPNINYQLKLAIEKAKTFNMPNDSIDRAIKKASLPTRQGVGEKETSNFEEVIYEAYGPGGTALMLEAITDNRNRTVAEIKHILSQYEGKLAEPGSVSWMFEKRAVIEIKKNKIDENKELDIIEAGAEDLESHEEKIDVYAKPENLENIKNRLIKKGVEIISASIDLVAKNPVQITNQAAKKKIEELFEALDDQEDVQEIYSNIKN
ncbi:MAG: YebC/PmpR family DNA-binding transcriptional regulator [Parcubacteria group bacterium]|nr:YebC/PmpR family DNA-binding transcriptional regulator [Parcubacteria group bacterium]